MLKCFGHPELEMLKCFGHPEFSSGQYDNKLNEKIANNAQRCKSLKLSIQHSGFKQKFSCNENKKQLKPEFSLLAY